MKITFNAGQRVQTNGTADFFRLLSTANPVTVEFYYQGREIAERVDVEGGFAEQFRTIEFDRVDIFSATAQTVQWETALGSEIRYDRGAATVNGSVDLNTATQNALIRPMSSNGNWQNTAALSLNTAVNIFTAGANTNGVILQLAESTSLDATNHCQAFVAKATAPATLLDGDVVAIASVSAYSTAMGCVAKLHKDVLIPAGVGLWFISNLATGANAGNARFARWRTL